MVKGLAFSPDSTKIAVGQTDNILFVYKVGEGWSDKKVICNKFIQQSAVTCLIWSGDQGVVFGLADGKVRLANVKNNKSSTIYNTDVFVCTLAPSPNANGFLSSHADGSIVRYFFNDGGSGEAQGKICTHPCPAYALVWAPTAILAAGCDKRVISYNRDGRLMQQFDYSRDDGEREFTTAALSPSGTSVVLGSFDRLRVLNWHSRRGAWDEGRTKDIRYLYTITTLNAKPDGSRVVAGTLCGSLELFDCCLKRSLLKNKFETTYVGPSQVIVKNIASGERAVVKSELGLEIQDVKVMGKDRYVVAQTPETILFADLQSGRTSEVSWQSSGNEKFYFDSENVAIIFNAGELSLVQYGLNDILASVRTEFFNPHLISVRLNERSVNGEEGQKMAYLVDLKTIAILDLRFGTAAAQVSHDAKIDWLELNETGRRLLFRDKRFRLHLYELESETRVTVLAYSTYVQWVPGSDVIVAQSRDNLAVCYNAADPERLTMFPIKGDVQELIRGDGETNVIVVEGSHQVAYTLDEGLIEFGTAMEDGDLHRAVAYLEGLAEGPESLAMWKTLATVGLQQRKLHVAQRAYAALGDIARTRYLEETNRLARQAAREIGGDGTQHYKVRARLAIMEKQLKEAERIYLEQNSLEEALEMYQKLHKWEAALELAEARGHPELESLRSKYYAHLGESGQDEKAGEVKEREGDVLGAVDLYLKANLPARAARLMAERPELLSKGELVQSVAVALIKSELFERAGELFEKTKDWERAVESYRRGGALGKAIGVARHAFPADVVKLEEEWGDELVRQKQMDAAINHYIESGNTVKAVEAAIAAKQWTKAVQIVEVVEDGEAAKEYYAALASHYAGSGELERAERFWLEAGLGREAVEMYASTGRWEQAHRLASELLEPEEARSMFQERAATLEAEGRLREAEQLYVAVEQPNRAINMYKEAGHHENMVRLVKQFHSAHVSETQAHLGKELEEQGRLAEAEAQYVQAGEWKSAVNMYRAAESWEEAYRVAKEQGGQAAPRQVAYLWAKSLGGDSAVKLLSKLGLLEEAVEYASSNGAFDFAFELCRLGLKKEMPKVHLKYAVQLEEDGEYAEAETQFLAAGRAKEAVMMYLHRQDYDAAQRVAEAECPESIPEVYVGQARVAFEKGDYARAESFLLRAGKPELALASYKELGQWQDALRVAKEYLPHLLGEVEAEWEQAQLKSGAKGAASYVAQARDWEEQSDYERAIDCYLKVAAPLTADESLMERCWVKAGELGTKFLSEKAGWEVVRRAGELLVGIGRHSAAAELYLGAGLAREATEALMEAGEWAKAKKVAVELEGSELAELVDARYKEALKSAGNVDELADVDVVSGIQLYIERGDWTKALETAAAQENPALLDKYTALFATEMINQGQFQAAAEAFEKYGAPANKQNFNIYKRLVDEMLSAQGTAEANSYRGWAALRNFLLKLKKNLESGVGVDERYAQVFGRFLLLAHYCAARAAFLLAAPKEPALRLLATQISIALLRFTDLPSLPADKAFYEAGIACRDQGGAYEQIGFVFLNHYLDLAEAIEEQNADAVDYSHLDGTDIPTEIELPERLHLPPPLHEEVKEYVLALSVDKSVQRLLRKDSRGLFESNLGDSPACILSAYPLLGEPKTFGNTACRAAKDAWNKLLMANKASHLPELEDVLTFLSAYTGTPLSMAL